MSQYLVGESGRNLLLSYYPGSAGIHSMLLRRFRKNSQVVRFIRHKNPSRMVYDKWDFQFTQFAQGTWKRYSTSFSEKRYSTFCRRLSIFLGRTYQIWVKIFVKVQLLVLYIEYKFHWKQIILSGVINEGSSKTLLYKVSVHDSFKEVSRFFPETWAR